MPIVFLIGAIVYYLVKAVWFAIRLPLMFLKWIVMGVFLLLAGIVSIISTVFRWIGEFTGFFWDGLWEGDGSVVGAKLLTLVCVVGTIIYLIVKHA